MKTFKLLIIIFLCILTSGISAQVTFVIQSLPTSTPATDSIFIAGDFSGWLPGQPEFMMHKNAEGKWSIILAAKPTGTVIQFKFTRGSWGTVEKGSNGEELGNRTYTYGGSSSVDIAIAKWADGGSGNSSTAAANVEIMSTDFYMPQFNRTRRIWIYFPPDYTTSGLSYPVLYMHDGQNLFDINTSFAGEWKVDETLNALAAQGKRVPIVVGIDNGGNYRIDEYTPWINPDYGGGQGDKYMQFIVETLKPYIDQHYRTLPDRENTGIMGSSLGGLISHFGSLKYQSVFSKAGIFSPSYWFSDSVWTFTHNTGKQLDMRFFQLCGTNEGSSAAGSQDVVIKMQRMNDSLVSIGFSQANIFNKVVVGGQHNEQLWADNFGQAYQWLFDSYITSVDEQTKVKGIITFPNPVGDVLALGTNRKILFDTILIFDANGRQVKELKHPNENKINIHDLKPGTYFIRCISKQEITQAKFIKQ